MALKLEIIEWFDDAGETLAYRIPQSGSGTFNMGSQLVVRESQKAVFFRDGKALDSLGPGRHTLSTLNLPVLTQLLSLPFGFQSPFKAEVVFVNLATFLDQKWGTSTPVLFRDSEFQMIRLRAFGVFSLRVDDPLLFINKIVGTQGAYRIGQLQDHLRELIVSRLNDLLGETLKTILDLPRYYDELAAALKGRLSDDFRKLGLEMLDFFIHAITPPDEVQKAMDEKAGMGVVGNLNQYMQYKVARAMENVSQGGSGGEGGGAAGQSMGMGLGAGFGMMMPGMLKKAMEESGKEGGSPAPATGAGGLTPGGGELIVTYQGASFEEVVQLRALLQGLTGVERVGTPGFSGTAGTISVVSSSDPSQIALALSQKAGLKVVELSSGRLVVQKS
ncbi:MAG: SPFH domain-containing protein [bacterium]